MERNLSLNLHVLTARLDRAADRILRAEHNVSYSRFVALTLVGELGPRHSGPLPNTSV